MARLGPRYETKEVSIGVWSRAVFDGSCLGTRATTLLLLVPLLEPRSTKLFQQSSRRKNQFQDKPDRRSRLLHLPGTRGWWWREGKRERVHLRPLPTNEPRRRRRKQPTLPLPLLRTRFRS